MPSSAEVVLQTSTSTRSGRVRKPVKPYGIVVDSDIISDPEDAEYSDDYDDAYGGDEGGPYKDDGDESPWDGADDDDDDDDNDDDENGDDTDKKKNTKGKAAVHSKSSKSTKSSKAMTKTPKVATIKAKEPSKSKPPVKSKVAIATKKVTKPVLLTKAPTKAMSLVKVQPVPSSEASDDEVENKKAIDIISNASDNYDGKQTDEDKMSGDESEGDATNPAKIKPPSSKVVKPPFSKAEKISDKQPTKSKAKGVLLKPAAINSAPSTISKPLAKGGKKFLPLKPAGKSAGTESDVKADKPKAKTFVRKQVATKKLTEKVVSKDKDSEADSDDDKLQPVVRQTATKTARKSSVILGPPCCDSDEGDQTDQTVDSPLAKKSSGLAKIISVENEKERQEDVDNEKIQIRVEKLPCTPPPVEAETQLPTPAASDTSPKRKHSSSSCTSSGSDTPRKKLAPAEKVVPTTRVAIIEALSAPRVTAHIDFGNVAMTFSKQGEAIPSAKLSRHWREVLVPDLKTYFATGSGTGKRAGKTAAQGGLESKHRQAIWEAACKVYDKADWSAVEEASGLSTTKLKRHFRDVLMKDAVKFITQT